MLLTMNKVEQLNTNTGERFLGIALLCDSNLLGSGNFLRHGETVYSYVGKGMMERLGVEELEWLILKIMDTGADYTVIDVRWVWNFTELGVTLASRSRLC
jgi:hypothetical protein